jgi:hypothetical protein
LIIYCTGHPTSRKVCNDLAYGLRRLPEGVELIRKRWPRPLEGPALFYGRGRGTLTIPRQAEASGFDWYMVDNGYLGRPKNAGVAPEDPARFDGYYKISKNGFQCTGREEPDYKRLEALLRRTRHKIPQWRESRKDSHILICPPIVEYEKVHWFDVNYWLSYVRNELREMTHRKKKIRYKPGDKRPGADPRHSLPDHDLTNCHAVITHDSNIVVDAALRGVPSFVTGDSPARVFGNTDLRLIETPNLDYDLERWFATLAANQWTLEEIRAGVANHLFA